MLLRAVSVIRAYVQLNLLQFLTFVGKFGSTREDSKAVLVSAEHKEEANLTKHITHVPCGK